MSTTNPNTIWTPDFFWEPPADAAEHINDFNALNAGDRQEATYLESDYFKSVVQATKDQSPERIREFSEFVMAKVASEGVLKVPSNPRTYATFQRVHDQGQAENGQNLTTVSERWLRTRVGREWTGDPDSLLTFDEQQARDAACIKRIGYTPESLAEVLVYTDSREMYEWPKMPGLVKDWPLVELKLRTSGLHLGVTYADYQRGSTLSIPATPERIEQMHTFIEQFSSGIPLDEQQESVKRS